MKKIALITTGGTIAGCADESGKYKAGVFPADKILEPVKHKLNINIEVYELANIDSKDMSEDIWKKLYLSVKNFVDNSDIKGVVITHGTDTMIETAFFIQSTVKTDKPIVFTGAMRPANAISADGAQNLLDAINVASSDEAKNHGTLVVMNNEIHSAFDVLKTHKNNVDAFKSPNIGKLGAIINNKPIFFSTLQTPQRIYNFDINVPFPYVPIITAFAGDNGELVKMAAKIAKGIVYAAFGAGTIPQKALEELHAAKKNGVKIMIAGKLPAGSVEFTDENFLSAGYLSPEKARILLMLEIYTTLSKKF